MKNIILQLMKSDLFLQAETSKVKLNIPLTTIVYFLLWLIGLMLGRLLALSVLNILEFIGNINESMDTNIRLNKTLILNI